MSRLKRFTVSLASGYVLLGGNTLYTLASVPLALHYLSKLEFGLWALVMQISGYLLLIDLGMAGSISRILIDHKDRPADERYGSIIKTGSLVLAAQGVIIGVGGAVLSYWLPALFKVPLVYWNEFRILVAGQCLIMGALFVGRMFNHILLAHQRYDSMNYSQLGGLAIGFALIWFGFARGWGLYGLLLGYAGSTLFTTVSTLLSVARLKLFPKPGAWGRADLKTFHELFSYGREIFLLSLGLQLVSASQVLVISRTLGLEAAAVWSIATKPFTLAQQFVYRLLDYSSAGLAEMMVRQERERLLKRFQDILVLSASLAVWVGLSVALCNQSFLALWTKGRIAWSPSGDWLMSLLVIGYATARCFIGFIGLTKQIRGMKYIYFLEGLAFVGLSLWATKHWGMNGVIVSAVLTDLLFSGVYGFWRTKHYFGFSETRTMLAWLRWPLWSLSAFAVVVSALLWLERDWSSPLLQFSVNAATATLVGFGLFWRLGLSPHLRAEASQLLFKLRARLRPSPLSASAPK